MRRVSRNWPNLADAMRFLGVSPPRVPREADQATLDRILESWKSVQLKKAYRRRAAETHPDHGGDEEEFKRVDSAYREICEYAKLAPPRRRVSPAAEFTVKTDSPFFSGGVHFRPREPHHGTGPTRDWTSWSDDRHRARPESVVVDDPNEGGLSKCRRCRTPRHEEANFCHECGAGYDEMLSEAIIEFKEQMNRVASAMDDTKNAWAGFAEALKRRRRDE